MIFIWEVFIVRRIFFVLLCLSQLLGFAAADASAGIPLIALSGVWWNPAVPGWGLALQRNLDNTIFAVLFIYDQNGRPTWYVMPDGRPQNGAVEGDVFQPTGPSYTEPVFDSTKVRMGDPVGKFRVAMNDQPGTYLYDGTFEFDIHGIHSSNPIEPYIHGGYGPLPSAIWWRPQESGWGLVTYNNFSALFMYGEDGHPTWFIVPDVRLIGYNGFDTRYFTGLVYQPSGPPLAATFDSSKVDAGRNVGIFNFQDYGGIFQYELRGVTATKELRRFTF